MRFIAMVKANADSEAGVMPSAELIAEMGAFNDELVKSGVLLAAEGLHPSARGARIRFEGDRRTVVDGPFAETKELVAGFWLLQAKSKAEVLEWFKRCPNPMPGQEGVIEIRQVFDAEDFGPELAAAVPEVFEGEKRFREAEEAAAAERQKNALGR
jgi:hypothetical protein